MKLKQRNRALFLTAAAGILSFCCASVGASSQPTYELIRIPAGESTLYIPVDNSYEITFIKKKYAVKKPFFIGKYEVTNNLWNQCNQAGICKKGATFKKNEGLNNPVTRVNWHDAQQFATWISAATGAVYRLPTEEEWTYAAFLGQEHKEIETKYDYTKIALNRLPEKITLPIGSYGSNAWGMNDVTGNVWEWTLTCWYGAEESVVKERTIAELNSAKTCTTRIALGETRSHIPDFISDTYGGGCATLRPAANLSFRLVKEE